jgi:hypothetical protein
MSCASIFIVPWPELELHGWSWESLPERGQRGKGRGRGGRGWGRQEDCRRGGCRREARSCSLFCVLYVPVHEERKQEGGRREEKRREEGKEKKEKEKKWEIFLNLEISKKIKDNL